MFRYVRCGQQTDRALRVGRSEDGARLLVVALVLARLVIVALGLLSLLPRRLLVDSDISLVLLVVLFGAVVERGVVDLLAARAAAALDDVGLVEVGELARDVLALLLVVLLGRGLGPA